MLSGVQTMIVIRSFLIFALSVFLCFLAWYALRADLKRSKVTSSSRPASPTFRRNVAAPQSGKKPPPKHLFRQKLWNKTQSTHISPFSASQKSLSHSGKSSLGQKLAQVQPGHPTSAASPPRPPPFIDEEFLRRPPLNSSVVWCSPHLYGNIDFERLDEWQIYYQALGLQQAFVYVSEVTPPEVLAHVKRRAPFFSAVEFDGKGEYYGQRKAISLCYQLVRERKFDWAFFGDLDEFLWWKGPHRTIREWLDTFGDARCITLGKRFHSRSVIHPRYCGVLAFPFTPPVPYCYMKGVGGRVELCDDWAGRRKYVIRPNLVGGALTVHQCPGPHVVVKTSEAHFKEYRGHLPRGLFHVPCTDVRSFPQPGNDASIPWYRESHGTDVLLQDRDLPEFMKVRLPRKQWASYNACRCSHKL
eukprot:RCo018644